MSNEDRDIYGRQRHKFKHTGEHMEAPEDENLMGLISIFQGALQSFSLLSCDIVLQHKPLCLCAASVWRGNIRLKWQALHNSIQNHPKAVKHCNEKISVEFLSLKRISLETFYKDIPAVSLNLRESLKDASCVSVVLKPLPYYHVFYLHNSTFIHCLFMIYTGGEMLMMTCQSITVWRLLPLFVCNFQLTTSPLCSSITFM